MNLIFFHSEFNCLFQTFWGSILSLCTQDKSGIAVAFPSPTFFQSFWRAAKAVAPALVFSLNKWFWERKLKV